MSGQRRSTSSRRSASAPPSPRPSARAWWTCRSSRRPSFCSGLLGAIVWDLITWYVGLPTSSSHALVGGYAGAAVAKAGWSALVVAGWTKTLIFIVLAPLMGMALGLLICRSSRCGSSGTSRPTASTNGSGGCSWCRPRSTASAMAPTTRRRRWGSSPACC